MATLIVATKNEGKVREILHLLKNLPLEVKGLSNYPQKIQLPEETGSTFVENARLKAHAVWNVTKGFVLADDSGLECADLAGSPGIYSARYAGLNATDDENNKKLLEELQSLHDASRAARYVCALVLIDPHGQETIVVETCEGMITFVPSGTGGFGYDPYFYLPDKKCTMAELSLDEKNKISHRGKALMCLKEKLSSYK